MGELACAEEDAAAPCRRPSFARLAEDDLGRLDELPGGAGVPGDSSWTAGRRRGPTRRPSRSTARAWRRGGPSAGWPRSRRGAGPCAPSSCSGPTGSRTSSGSSPGEAEAAAAPRLLEIPPAIPGQRAPMPLAIASPRPGRRLGACSRSTCRPSAISRRSWRWPSARARTPPAAGCWLAPFAALVALRPVHRPLLRDRLPLRVERARGGPADPLLRGGARDRRPRLPPAQLAQPPRRRPRRLRPLLPRDEHGLVARRRWATRTTPRDGGRR